MPRNPLLLAMKNKKPALQGSMMDVLLSLMLKTSSSSWLPLVFQDKADLWRTCHPRKSWRNVSFANITRLLWHRQPQPLCRGMKEKQTLTNSLILEQKAQGFSAAFTEFKLHYMQQGCSAEQTYLKLPIYTLTGNNIRYASEFFLWKM